MYLRVLTCRYRQPRSLIIYCVTQLKPFVSRMSARRLGGVAEALPTTLVYFHVQNTSKRIYPQLSCGLSISLHL